MGFAATGNAYCLSGDAALQYVANCVEVVKNILPVEEDLPSHFRRIQHMLTRCRNHAITFNKGKFMVVAPNVSFCGYRLSADVISADEDKVWDTRDFPTHDNLTSLRSFMGLVSQWADLTPATAATTQPLRPLMNPKRSFTWTPGHDNGFAKVKRALSSPLVLAPFDPALAMVLQKDASRLYAIGYALLQGHGQGRLRLVRCGSRFLTGAETCYATIKLEMLAVTWAASKCRIYLSVLPHFTLMTDHRQLIKHPCILDALSRALVSHPTSEDETDCELRARARMDSAYGNLLTCVSSGVPSNRFALPSSAIPYWKLWDVLSTGGELLCGKRIVVPAALRKRTLARLHDSHSSARDTKRWTRQTVFWPGIDSDIKKIVEACKPCQVLFPRQQQEPFLCDDRPIRVYLSSSSFTSQESRYWLWRTSSQAGPSSRPATRTRLPESSGNSAAASGRWRLPPPSH
ncbi:uncharacterized protein LOC143030448 [Oratosquilla oratoria]|uniref:uncharacterized protein LOC143030448 n=1 Tax=Oratosquilla oratoria TaxID=337810 RepID=UPI003F764F18